MTQLEIQQTVESIWSLFRETDQRLDQRMEETRHEIAALSAQTRAAQELFTGQWGRLLEALVRPGVVELFQARGISRSTVAWSGHGCARAEQRWKSTCCW